MSYEALEVRDQISKNPLVGLDELAGIVDRLYSTHTISSMPDGPPKGHRLNNEVARAPASEDEMKEIYDRLHTSKTKSSLGGETCKPAPDVKMPGYGLKVYPIIEGIETRFKGNPQPKSKVSEAAERLLMTQTKASQSRLDNPRVLLYPERTTLMNNVERIVAYQQTGAVAKQNIMERREKWYN